MSFDWTANRTTVNNKFVETNDQEIICVVTG